MGNKNALIVGIRDEESICYAIANEIKRAGYNIYATYEDEDTYAGVSRAAGAMGIEKLFPYDARRDEDLEVFTSAVRQEGISLDILVHGISYSTAEGAKLDLAPFRWWKSQANCWMYSRTMRPSWRSHCAGARSPCRGLISSVPPRPLWSRSFAGWHSLWEMLKRSGSTASHRDL